MSERSGDLGRELARIAIFAALIIVLGMVTVPLPTGVPITGQTLGVMLAGTVLGPRRGPLAVLLVLVLAAIGLPVLAGGHGGIASFTGPSAGYLVGWVAGAFVTGLIAHSGRMTWWRTGFATVVGGIGVVLGLVASAFVTRVLTSMLFGVTPTDAPTMVFVSGGLLLVSALAAFGPAWRAAQVQPLDALRS